MPKSESGALGGHLVSLADFNYRRSRTPAGFLMRPEENGIGPQCICPVMIRVEPGAGAGTLGRRTARSGKSRPAAWTAFRQGSLPFRLTGEFHQRETDGRVEEDAHVYLHDLRMMVGAVDDEVKQVAGEKRGGHRQGERGCTGSKVPLPHDIHSRPGRDCDHEQDEQQQLKRGVLNTRDNMRVVVDHPHDQMQRSDGQQGDCLRPRRHLHCAPDSTFRPVFG